MSRWFPLTPQREHSVEELTHTWMRARTLARQTSHALSLTAPVDVDEVCRRLNVPFAYGDLQGRALGLAVETCPIETKIYIEKDMSRSQQVISMAHCLGRVLDNAYQSAEGGRPAKSFQYGEGGRAVMFDKCDVGAYLGDCFACELLMPSDGIVGYVDSPIVAAAKLNNNGVSYHHAYSWCEHLRELPTAALAT